MMRRRVTGLSEAIFCLEGRARVGSVSCYESFGTEELGCMEAIHILGVRMPACSGGCRWLEVKDGV